MTSYEDQGTSYDPHAVGYERQGREGGGWIEHHGKGYPDLPRDTLVQVRFADGLVCGQDTPEPVTHWHVCWRWASDEPSYHDITHYRVVKP